MLFSLMLQRRSRTQHYLHDVFLLEQTFTESCGVTEAADGAHLP